MYTRLFEELSVVARRLRFSTQMTVLSILWLLFFFIAWGLSKADPLFGVTPAMGSLVFLGICLLISAIFIIASRNWFSDPKWVASRIESQYPELESRLLTSIDQVNEFKEQNIGFLQQLLLTQTINHSVRNPWEMVVSSSKFVFSQLAAICAFTLLLLGAVMMSQAPPVVKSQKMLGDDAPEVVSQPELLLPTQLESVEPGNAEVENGSSLIVLAKFSGQLPEKADLVYECSVPQSDGESELVIRRIAMNPSFDDPIFAGQIENVTQPLTYWVEFDNQTSDRFYVTVFEYPSLQQLDFELDFPEYTKLPNKVVNDARRVSALLGTNVTITARLNKSVRECVLVSKAGDSIALSESPTGDAVYSASFVVTESNRFDLQLRDDSDRRNKLPPEISINALSNQPPIVKITMPGRDLEVSPLEELDTQAKISDDYGVHRTGMTYSIAGGMANELVLGKDLESKKEHLVEKLIDFESLNAAPNQLVSYFYWAEDFVDDGKTRRIMSDLFFAEVREFEQIFRQGEQQSQSQQQRQQQQQQSQQQQQQAAELMDLQKEIINATWKLIRRETDDQPSSQFASDVSVIQESQQMGIGLVDELAEKMANNPQAGTLATQIKTAMNGVVLTLQKSIGVNSANPLVDAVSQEQQVYQMLLKLQSDDSQVQQQQQQQQQSQSQQQQQSRSQQQLQQLQLENDRNRYEEENQAQKQQEEDAEKAEVRQALNRLKELARRQEDINEQLEKLQTALEAAKDDAEKAEIERRLKRLREQQEELLRDLDELKSDAEQNQDNKLMQNATEELDKARENVRKSAEALKENQVTKAAAAGNRAQQQFEDLREEFKKGNANQFVEQMKEMSTKAQELQDKQTEIAEQIQNIKDAEGKSLREQNNRDQLKQELSDQRKKYDDILKDIKEVVRDAEESEPLLSQQLFDTYQQTRKSKTVEEIDLTRQMLSQGFIDEAEKTNSAAEKGVAELNEGVQKAAQSIVGDESESLRRAEQTLRKLANQINREIQENNPSEATSAEDSEGGVENENRQPNGDQTGGDQDGEMESSQSESQQQKNGNSQQGKQEKNESKTGKRGGQKNVEQGKSEQGESEQGKSEQGESEQGESGRSKGEQKGNQDSKRSGEPSGKQESGRSGEKADQKQNDQKSGGSPEKQGQNRDGKTDGKRSKSGKGGQEGGQSRGNQAQNPSQPNGQPSQRPNGASGRFEGFEEMFGPTGGTPRPITGDQYRQFSNDLREIEELLEDPKMRSQAAEIREQAKAIRVEMKRHSKDPNWEIVQDFIAEPLEKLRAEVARELILKENREALVPIDRDPVPAIFEAQVQEYYKELSDVEK
jgi:hypothetical protein